MSALVESRDALKPGDCYALESILSKVGGWIKFTGNKTGKKYVPLYGPQRVFVRSGSEVKAHADFAYNE